MVPIAKRKTSRDRRIPEQQPRYFFGFEFLLFAKDYRGDVGSVRNFHFDATAPRGSERHDDQHVRMIADPGALRVVDLARSEMRKIDRIVVLVRNECPRAGRFFYDIAERRVKCFCFRLLMFWKFRERAANIGSFCTQGDFLSAQMGG